LPRLSAGSRRHGRTPDSDSESESGGPDSEHRDPQSLSPGRTGSVSRRTQTVNMIRPPGRRPGPRSPSRWARAPSHWQSSVAASTARAAGGLPKPCRAGGSNSRCQAGGASASESRVTAGHCASLSDESVRVSGGATRGCRVACQWPGSESMGGPPAAAAAGLRVSHRDCQGPAAAQCRRGGLAVGLGP
jgi:hypothetical protein